MSDKKLNEKPKKEQYVRRLNLKNLSDARRLIARIIKQVQNNEISVEKAKALGYLVNVFNGTYEKSELENRINEIKDHLGVKL